MAKKTAKRATKATTKRTATKKALGTVVVVAGQQIRTVFAATLVAAIENAKAAWREMFNAFRRTGRMNDSCPEKKEYRRLLADIEGLTAGEVKASVLYTWIGETA